MEYRAPARSTSRRIPTVLVIGLLVGVGTTAFLGHPFLSSASLTPEPSQPTPSAAPATAAGSPSDARPAARPLEFLRATPADAPREADGVLPAGVTVFDTGYPGIANLDPDLVRALRSATTAAARHGVKLFIESGWRSGGYQDWLLRRAVSEYGSLAEAARWVATADTSPHVSGDAVDIGPSAAMAWLSEHGSRYGLCQIYRNEPWHYELRAGAADHGCPRMYADPTHDPRMQG
jgi:D-alanyl-D-alanine carboxypeptidase